MGGRGMKFDLLGDVSWSICMGSLHLFTGIASPTTGSQGNVPVL